MTTFTHDDFKVLTVDLQSKTVFISVYDEMFEMKEAASVNNPAAEFVAHALFIAKREFKKQYDNDDEQLSDQEIYLMIAEDTIKADSLDIREIIDYVDGVEPDMTAFYKLNPHLQEA